MISPPPNLECPYCRRPPKLVRGDVIYPHRQDLRAKQFWSCRQCDAYVGCHPGTIEPLGRLANAELRRAKMSAHAALDPLWRSGKMTRKQAYAWLRDALSMSPGECHIGMFDVGTCEAVVAACKGRN